MKSAYSWSSVCVRQERTSHVGSACGLQVGRLTVWMPRCLTLLHVSSDVVSRPFGHTIVTYGRVRLFLRCQHATCLPGRSCEPPETIRSCSSKRVIRNRATIKMLPPTHRRTADLTVLWLASTIASRPRRYIPQDYQVAMPFMAASALLGLFATT